MRQGKNWGYTTEFFRNAMVSAYHLEIKEGGFCSEHRHKYKHNLFYVITGVLEVRIWHNGKSPDITLVEAGQSTAILPGFYHQFIGKTKCEAIEIYQILLTGDDIERRTVGGIKK